MERAYMPSTVYGRLSPRQEPGGGDHAGRRQHDTSCATGILANPGTGLACHVLARKEGTWF